MKSAGTRKNLVAASKEARESGYYNTTILYEGNFIKNAAAKAKAFLKKGYASIKKSVTGFIKDLKKQFSNKNIKMIEPGTLAAFQYNAKFKDKTAWDKSPLVIMLGPSRKTKGNFYGLNMHHLPINDRVNIASFFLELKKKRKGKIQYSDVKPFMVKFKGHPVLRQYIFNRVSNRVYVIDEEMFLTAAAVPSEDIVKAIRK